MSLALFALLLLGIPSVWASEKRNNRASSPRALFADLFFWIDFSRFCAGFILLKWFLNREENIPALRNLLKPFLAEGEGPNALKLMMLVTVMFLFPHLLSWRRQSRKVLQVPISYVLAAALTVSDPVIGMISVLSGCLIALSQGDLRLVLPVLATTFSVGIFVVAAGIPIILLMLTICFAPQFLAAFMLRSPRFI